MKARAGEYRPKQTDYDIADGINRSFAKKGSSKFIKFINGMVLFVDRVPHHQNFAAKILRNFKLEADDRKRDEDSNSFSY